MPPKKKKKITARKPDRKASGTKKKKKAPAGKILKKKAPQKKIVKKAVLKPQGQKAKQDRPKAKEVKAAVIGKVTHYFPHVNAAVLKLKLPLKIGDTIQIKGHTTDIKETVTSMQINRAPITAAKKGDEIGLFVASRVRAGDTVYKP